MMSTTSLSSAASSAPTMVSVTTSGSGDWSRPLKKTPESVEEEVEGEEGEEEEHEGQDGEDDEGRPLVASELPNRFESPSGMDEDEPHEDRVRPEHLQQQQQQHQPGRDMTLVESRSEVVEAKMSMETTPTTTRDEVMKEPTSTIEMTTSSPLPEMAMEEVASST